MINIDGTGATLVTDHRYDELGGTLYENSNDFEPAWSPDGKKIAFSSNRDGALEIYVVNVDGTGRTRLTDNTEAASHPAWSPDGAKIVFASGSQLQSHIILMNPDGSS